MSRFIKKAALELAKAKGIEENGNYLAEEIDKLVRKHALIAVGSAWIPLPCADIVAMTANLWVMYVSINKKYNMAFSEHALKSIGSAILGNLTSNIVALGAGSILKLIPGSVLFTGTFLSALVYATTLTAAWVYLRALTKFVERGGGSEAGLQMCVNNVLFEENETIKSVFKDSKSDYKK